jgi:SAM-dependent methyltransferase
MTLLLVTLVALDRFGMKLDHCAQTYWDGVAETYDQVFPETLIGRVQRDAVWREIGRVFQPGQRILELNCGTGIDAVYLAGKSVRVLACDISQRMIALASSRAVAAGVSHLIDFRVLPTEEISQLAAEQPFDGVFSNFSGLNCVADHSAVARNLASVLRPGAYALFCMMGRLVPLEVAWFLVRGRLDKVTERWRGSSRNHDSVAVHVPSVRAMAKAFAPEFRLKNWKGVGVAVPPSSLDYLARRIPRTINLLASVDRWVACVPGLRNLADCVLLQFQRV